jgi:hypothetical protein
MVSFLQQAQTYILIWNAADEDLSDQEKDHINSSGELHGNGKCLF